MSASALAPGDQAGGGPMTADLTADERDQIAHAVGHRSAKGCSVHGGRNHYVTSADDPLWSGLVDRGLATRGTSRALGDGDAVFCVTADGVAALEADPRSACDPRPGRIYTVAFRGYEQCPVTVRGETRGKAKASAAREMADIFPDGDAYMRIVSCRVRRESTS